MPLKTGYNWQYCSLGGVTRVRISSGEDIAHLGELDRKLWTVLSCPVKGLEFDSRTLQLLDVDGDNKIRIDEVVEAAQWITGVLANSDDLLLGSDTLRLEQLGSSESAVALRNHCVKILEELERPAEAISMKDLSDYRTLLDKRFADEAAAAVVVDMRPYGDDTASIVDAVTALRDKVADFYMRCHLVRFDADCRDAVDVSVERIAAIAAGDVAKQAADIATYPLARPAADGLLHLRNINPAWTDQMAVIADKALHAEGDDAVMTSDQWNEIVGKVDAYTTNLTQQADGHAAQMSESQKEATERYAAVEKLLHIYRDFYTLLKNYVFFRDFYQKDSDVKAIFQNGRLFIDQRCCELCMRVDNIDAHAAMASASGMYLLYCTCTSRVKNETINIVAVLTDGDVDNLSVGKNAVYYDRSGLGWDAVVTKIIDNPISIRQAFWSPYRKFWNWCTDKINKSAAEKEDKAFNDLTAKAETTTESVKAGAEGEKAEAPKKVPFDIAKFAGIFAAIGMAVGYIASAATGLTKSIGDNPWNLLILVAGIIIVISGPSMFIAWTKLRKRNLGPMLNANGWAVNAVVLVNVRFGATLTSIAQYPKLVLDDPFVDKKMPKWKKWTIAICSILAAAAITLQILYWCNVI
ncbi:MAG: hypothetical protein IJR13_07895 [Bacteroidales bacterium]|nr:hypothetical protein [Bacteroidales bacterium]